MRGLLAGLAPPQTALVLGCDAAFTTAFTAKSTRITCLANSYDDLDSLPHGVTAIKTLPPRGAGFHLLIVPSIYWHSQRDPSITLRRLRTRLAPNAPALIFSDGAVGHLGRHLPQQRRHGLLDGELHRLDLDLKF